jgi:hypothetical protein
VSTDARGILLGLLGAAAFFGYILILHAIDKARERKRKREAADFAEWFHRDSGPR